ncbi:MAG: hypothetical protein Q4A05_10135 [Ruminococcus sp.]|nr:hypothetical protein [Ruminococcus sp.]
MKYEEKVQELRKHSRITGFIIVIIGILCAAVILPVTVNMAKNSSVLLILPAIIIPALCIALGMVNMLLLDKRLKKMWANVGIHDTNEISALFDKRTVFDKYDGDYAFSDDIIMNFDSLKAYRAEDITEISEKDIRDRDNEGRKLATSTYFINFKLSGNSPYKKDVMSFGSKSMRDTAYETLLKMTSLK